MAGNVRLDVDFSALFRKLGHSLEEIRVRSLKNILSKLDHKLICEADLVHERHLLIRLLEWFNFEPCPMQTQVLELLLTLAKHSGAAEILMNVGGLDFLVKLRQNCEVDDQPLVDQLMECLMRLPNPTGPGPNQTPECLYRGETTHDAPITASQVTHSQIPPFNQSITSQHSSWPSQSHYSEGHAYQTSPRGLSINTGYHGELSHNAPVGYFTSAGQMEGPHSPTESTSALPQCFKLTTFPWLPLTSTDLHVLSSTNSSLQSRDGALLTSACEFLSDVVFQDFPAEVFLQRPAIVKSLFSLLSAAPEGFEHLPTQSTQTLTDLTHSLKSRVLFYQDPALYTPKQDFSSPAGSSFSSRNSSSQSVQSFEPRPPAIGHSGRRHRGDGRDQDSSTNGSMSRSGSSVLGDPQETDAEDTQALQLMQMTLPQFCVFTMDASLPLLKKTSGSSTSHSLQLVTTTLGLLAECLTQHIWLDNTAAARESVEKLEEILEKFGELLHFHHHSNWSHGSKVDSTPRRKDTEQHRVVYIGLSACLVQLLNIIVPVEQADSCLPEILVGALSDLIYDESLSRSHPHLRAAALQYIQVVSPDKYQSYTHTVSVCKSMENACQFSMDFDPKALTNLQDYLPLALSCLEGLPYHQHGPLITQCVQLASVICIHDRDLEYQPLLLKLMSHPVAEIRVMTYRACYNTITTSLSVEAAADPRSRASENVAFLLDTRILQEVIYYGLSDSNKEVLDLSDLMLTHLLQSELLMSAELWTRLLSALLPVLPVLQGHTEIQTTLGSCLMGLTEPEMRDKETWLPPLERFRGCLRLMLSADTKCRAESLKRLAWFLSHEEDSHLKLPTFADLDVSNITNLFIVKSPRLVDEDDRGQTVIRVEGMQKVYGIFVSETVEPAVRKSAIEQLSIILQDSSLHSAFIKEGGVEKITDVLQRGVQKGNDGTKENFTVYIPACLKILRHLAHHSSSLRHRLAHDDTIYYCLLRGALLYHGDCVICYQASHLLTLLLFDEVAMFQIRSSTCPNSVQTQHKVFSLPAAVVKRYRLPFKTASHDDTSPHQVASTPEPDPLTNGMPAEMLRVTWNVAWHCGMSKLLACLKQSSHYSKSSQEFSSHLHLSPTDKVILCTSQLDHSLQQCLYHVSNATSHTDVTTSLQTLMAYLSTPSGETTTQLLHQLHWQQVMGRFLRTVPSSTSDESLLFEVLRFVSTLLKSSNQAPDDILLWLVETLYQPTGPLIGLLSRSTALSDGDANARRQLDKQLLTFISTYSRQLPLALLNKPDIGQLRGNLSHKLLLRLNVAEAPHFYNLAMLEGTLHCLMTITARPGWSEECTDLDSPTLCSQLLNSLLEVVSAFHIGRGGTSMSYMGKGVTKAATLCLRQLAYEMATSTEDKDWPQNWLYSRQGTDAVGEPGLNWMLTLWAYRDPEVRAAGLGIAVALTSTESGRIMLTSNCKHIPGGIWGAAFSILLDQSECSMVRQQAALLLVNLTSQTMPSENLVSTDPADSAWQGPVVTDTEYQLSLVGLPALLTLLHHSQFYQEMRLLFDSFFPHPAIHPVSVASSPPGSLATSQTTITTLESSMTSRPTVTNAGIGGHPSHLSNRQLYTSTPTQSLISGSQGRQPRSQVDHGTTSRSVATPLTTTTMSTPSVFGAQVGGEMSSSSLMESQESGEYQGVTTPGLVSAVCHLLRNLVLLAPLDTLNSLKQEASLHSLFSLIDVELLEAYCVEMTKGKQILRYQLVFADLLDMITSLVKLSKVLLTCSSPELCQQVMLQQSCLKTLTSLFALCFHGQSGTQGKSSQLLVSLYMLFSYILSSSVSALKQAAAEAIKDNWQLIMENVQLILKSKRKGDKDVYVNCLQFVAVFLSTEAKLTPRASNSWTDLLDTAASGDTASPATGSQLAQCLLEAYECVPVSPAPVTNPKEKTMVNNAFRLLLALSHSAKSTALDAGLVESLITQIRQLTVRLNQDPPQLTKHGSKKKEDPVSQDIILALDLLKNFMFEDIKVKTAAHHSGLGNLVHRLWAWCQLIPALMTSALSLLTTFTARCPPAAASLSFTSLSSVNISPPSTKGPLSSNSLMHALIKFAQHDLEKAPTQLCAGVFRLLAVLALSTECRNILWKSNFLNEFSRVNPKKQKKTKSKQCLEVLWLDLLLNLSFSTEGQQMICKLNDSIVLLLEFGQSSSACREKAMLILRNLCFHAGNKPKLLANDQVIPFLVKALWSERVQERAVASSGLYALALNNQKAKNALKNTNIVMKAQELLGSYAKNEKMETQYSQSVQNLQNLIATVSE